MTQVYIFEDEPEILDNIVDILTAAGFDAAGTVNSLDGLSQVQQTQPAVIVCDIGMPVMDGYTVLQSIRQDARTAAVPFIFLTGQAERDRQREGMELGADDYITKPFTQAELLKAIQAQLQKHSRIKHKYEATLQALRGNIAYALPHELRTPLTQIQGFADLMLLSEGQMQPVELLEAAGAIRKGCDRLNNLIENYLVYAQLDLIEGDPSRAQAVSGDPYQAATVARIQAEQQANRHDRLPDLILELEEGALRLSEEDFGKVISEMIDNAFKFSDRGTPVTLRGRARDGSYQVEIVDRGWGMTRDQIAAVGAYMQFDRKLHEQQGMGLGLAIARRLIEFHQGRLTITSEVGKGTTMTFSLPLADRAAQDVDSGAVELKGSR
ncbi:MAG: response regulator [Anaerolineae bacterium]|nr:response regulator [Anaerolineae bacterium]